MLCCASMSKQSDGINNKQSFCCCCRKCMLKVPTEIFVIGDCEVDCIMRLFQPRTISYTDYTDWNYDCT